MKQTSMLVAVLVLCGVCAAQVSTDEATKKLQGKQAARTAEREKMVMVKAGELEDLRAEVARLKAELALLKSQPSAEPVANVATPPILEITQGVTRQQIHQFVSLHRDNWAIAREIVQNKTGIMSLVQFTKTSIKVGQRNTGIRNQTADIMQDVRDVHNKLELQITDDLVSGINKKECGNGLLYEDNRGHEVKRFGA